MARFATKNLTPAKLKNLRKELSASSKELANSQKLNAKAVAAATGEHDAVLKGHATAVAALAKSQEKEAKASAKARDGKLKALEKESAKLQVQVDAHAAKLAEIEKALSPEALV